MKFLWVFAVLTRYAVKVVTKRRYLTTRLRSVTSQKVEYLIYTAAEA
jgi:GTPase